MKAQVINHFGDASVFELVEMPKPVITSGKVLIKVMATSVNPIDCKIRSGAVPDIAPYFPAVLHGDVAGIVEAVAEDVTAFKKGDEVYGYAGGVRGQNGALAEYLLADARVMQKKPKNASFAQAAALPVVSITAWLALFERATLKKGQSILIHGGVGGVGHIAVQLAKYAGAQVYTTVTKEADIPLAKSFGADEVILSSESVDDYVTRLTQGKGFEIVFDTVGGPNLANSLKAAAINGQVVTTAARTTLDLTPMHHKALSLHVVFILLPLVMNENLDSLGKALSEITQLVETSQLKIMLDPHSFTLAEVCDAHRLVESHLAKGKVVLSYL